MTTAPVPRRLAVMPLTCADDGREHLSEDEVFLLGRTGGYAAALCGHQTRIGPACAPVGRRCQHCEAHRQARETPPSPAPRPEPPPRRHRKPTWLTRLLRAP